MNNLKLLQKQHIMKRFILLLFSFLITFSLNYSFAVGGVGGGSGDFVSRPPGIPACSGLDAPSQTACTATEICDMHGYCGTTSSSYTVDTWSNLTSAFCGSIENNSFLTFTAEEPSITIDVYVYGCNDNEAIQVFLFEANNCSGGPVTGIECGNEMYAQDTPYTLSANGLVPGNDYYIMIDGYAGDVCDYSFVAGSGVSLPTSVDVPDITLCMGETVTVTASGGDGNFTWDPSPNLSSTTGATVTITPPTTPGVYTYNVHSTSTSNCGVDPSVATVTVTVDNCGCPVVASNSGPVCEGDLFDLQANFTGNITSYFWEGPNGFTSADLNPTGITPPSAPGSYEYTIFATVDGIECQSSTTVTVTPCPNGCNLENIRATYAAEGLIEIETCVSECSMYFLNTQSMSGSEAQDYAESLGANLVSIQSQAENDCLLAGLNTLGQTGTIWIGLNDEDVEGTFVWYDQSPVTYTNWAPGEPNNSGGNEDCVQIYPTGSSPGMWNDLNCGANNSKSIIEVNLCPVVDAGPNITICEGDTAVIQSSPTILGSAPYTYQWDNGGPSTYENSVTPSTTTEYVLTSEDQFGCIGEDAMPVEVIPLPVVNAGNDVTICEGEIIILNGSGEGTWDHGVVNGVPFEPTSTQTYTYTVTNNGCSESDQVTVTVRDLPEVGVVPSEVWGCGNLEVEFTNLFQETGVDYTINFG